MKTISVSHEIKTGDIKVMSNLTSFTANANRISRLNAVKGKNMNDSPSIHIDFQVKPHQEQLPSVIGETEELDLVLSVDDAMQIGILLVAMGLEDKSELEVDEVFQRLFKLTCKLHD
jgi:hypothetical protein